MAPSLRGCPSRSDGCRVGAVGAPLGGDVGVLCLVELRRHFTDRNDLSIEYCFVEGGDGLPGLCGHRHVDLTVFQRPTIQGISVDQGGIDISVGREQFSYFGVCSVKANIGNSDIHGGVLG